MACFNLSTMMLNKPTLLSVAFRLGQYLCIQPLSQFEYPDVLFVTSVVSFLPIFFHETFEITFFELKIIFIAHPKIYIQTYLYFCICLNYFYLIDSEKRGSLSNYGYLPLFCFFVKIYKNEMLIIQI